MDQNNIISITSDLEKLNMDMMDWQSMTYNQRKRSDEECIQVYGMTNTSLYNTLKSNIEKLPSNPEEVTDMVFEGATLELIDDDDKEDRFKVSNALQQDSDIIIINPFLIDSIPDYSIEELEEKMARFQSLTDTNINLSNSYSLYLWGYDVYNMYRIMKSKLQSAIEKDLTVNPSSIMVIRPEATPNKPIANYTEISNEYIQKEIEDGDTLSLMLRKLDYIAPKDTLTESLVCDRFVSTIDDKLSHDYHDYTNDIPQVTPFFTPDEFENLTGNEVDPFEYILQDQRELHEKIKEAMTLFNKDASEKNRQSVLELGWNPYIQYNGESMKVARERQAKWMNENKRIQIIDVSNMSIQESVSDDIVGMLEPIYIFLLNHDGFESKMIRKFSKGGYSHAGISFTDKMDKIYSFNDPGFSEESLDLYKTQVSGINIQVATFFVTKEIKKKLQDVVKWYIKNKDKTKYDNANLVRYVFKKKIDSANSLAMVCSQFVDNTLKMCNIDLTNKPSNLVAPSDFEHPAPGTRLFVLFKDKIEKFKPSIIRNKIKALLKMNSYDSLITLPTNEAVDAIFSTMLLESLMVNVDDPATNEHLREIRQILTPTNSIVEAKLLPIRFNKKGDLYIDLPKKLEEEYQEAHRLLMSYNTDNLEGIKHQLARLFYLNAVLESRIRKSDSDNKQYKGYVDLRARVLNDFKKYIKIVNDQEKNFDFESYFKNTEYYNKTIKIDTYTLKHTGELIHNFIKSLGI